MYLNKKFSFIPFYNLLFISNIHEKTHSPLDVETDKVIRTMEREENLKENSVKNLCRYMLTDSQWPWFIDFFSFSLGLSYSLFGKLKKSLE